MGNRSDIQLIRYAILLLTGVCFCSYHQTASAEIFINEIFFDPGGDGLDTRDEYIELRGTPGMSLANHYLVILENENDPDSDGEPGAIDNVFDLNFNPVNSEAGQSIGANGFFSLRQRNNLYTNLDPGANNLSNTGTGAGIGWGNGANSLVGHSGAGVVIENSGFTAFLIRDNSGENAPAPHWEESPGVMKRWTLDNNKDGLDSEDDDDNDWRTHWTILDSIGVHSEFGEAYYGRLYANVNFGPEKVGEPIFEGGPIFENPNVEPGAVYVGLGFEIEYVGRWGNSTGQTPADWHASNVTDEGGSGSAGVPDFRQSCEDVVGPCHPGDDGDPNTPAPQPGPTESNQGVLYGVKLMNSLGAPNFITGDYNKDGIIDTADYVVWRKSVGQVGNESNHPAADGNHDFMVNDDDYAVWASRFGQPNGGSSGAGAIAAASSVPEPSSFALLVIALFSPLRRSFRRRI